MAHQYWKPQTGGSTCPAPMTRAALLALRAANGLNVECVYTVTDHVQNRLVAGTTVTLHAVSTNELAETAMVNTTYDNEAWTGVYDLDRALVLELTDNRGNVAKGFNGTEVANFDWGNAAYTGCRVENAAWTVTYGNAAVMTQVSVLTGASLNTLNFVGTIQNSVVQTSSVVTLSSANGSWRHLEWRNGGSFNASGYTGGSDSYYSEFDGCTFNISGTTGAVTLRSSEFQNCTITAQGAQAFLILASQYYTQTISRPATGGAVNIDQGSSRENGFINHTGAGSLNTAGTQTNGTIIHFAPGPLSVSYCSIDQSAMISHFGTGALDVQRTALHGAGTSIIADAGSTITTSVNDCTLRSNGTIRLIGTVTAGTFTVSNTSIAKNSFIYKRHPGTLTVQQCALDGAAGIYALSGDRSYNFTQFNMIQVARVTLTGTGAVTDTLANVEMAYRGNMTISCSGPANNFSYGYIGGFSGSMVISGTTGSQSISRVKLRDGSMQFSNCTVNLSVVLCTAEDGGVIQFNSVVDAKTCQYLRAATDGRIIINNSTGGGATTRIDCTAGGQFVQSGAAATATSVDVAQGAVAHNGGSVTYCHKRMSGQLTTGNFVHQDIVHISATPRTLTAANTGRAEYVGLAPGAYTATGNLI